MIFFPAFHLTRFFIADGFLSHTDLKDFKDCYAASGYALINNRRAGAGHVPVRDPNGK